MSKHLLPPTHPIAFIFATIHVQLSVLEDKITGNTTALSFTQLNISKKKKKKKARLEHAFSQQLKTRGQQELAAAMLPAEESSGPPHKPKTKKHVTFANCAVPDNTATGSLWKWFIHESSNYR